MRAARIVAAAWMLALCVASLDAAHAASPNKPKGTSAAEKRMMELQARTPAQDLWEHGDWHHDPKRWQRTWQRTKRGLERVKPEDIAWGKTKRAIKSRVVVLDPPLAKTVGPDTVQVEWFGAPIDDAATTGIWSGLATIMLLNWAGSWYDDPAVPVTFQIRAIGKGPQLLRTFNPQRRIFQEMIYGWETEGDPSVYRGLVHPGTAVMAKLVDTEKMGNRPVFITSRESAMLVIDEMVRESEEKFPGWLERNGLESSRDWLSNIDLPGTKQAIEDADKRYRMLMDRASKLNRKVLKPPQDPIILIDGKYLLTGPLSGKGRDLFRMANWLIERQIKEDPRVGFSFDDIKYRAKREPEEGELTVLARPFPTGGGIEVEWLYTYVTGKGEANEIPWLDQTLRGWEQHLIYDVTGVRVKRSPIVSRKGRFRRHQRVHQEAAMAWGSNEILTRQRVRAVLGEQLTAAPDGLPTHETVAELLHEKLGVAPQAYDRARSDEASRSEVAELREKATVVNRIFARREATDPVFLVNGRYVLAAGSVTNTFQTLNWLIERLVNKTPIE